MGQGARTIFAQIAAQELGAPLDWVTVVMGDTAVVPYDQQTSASRSSVLMGNAVLRGLPRDPGQAPSDGRAARGGRRGGRRRRGAARSGSAIGRWPSGTSWPGVSDGSVARSSASASRARRPSPTIRSAARSAFYEFNCTAVEVEVDRGTGDITIHRYVTVSDVGKALNPSQVRGQDEGAAVMGLGHTLMEHYILDDTGRIRNLGAIDYRIPTEHGPAAPDRERHDRERRRTGPVRREGHERGRAAAGRAGRRRGRRGCDRRRRSGTCRCRPSGSGGRCRSRDAEPQRRREPQRTRS